MISASRVVGNRIYIVQSGAAFTVPSAGTVSNSTKPGSADASWVDLGVVDDFSIKKNAKKIEVYGPRPGRRVRTKTLETNVSHDIEFTGKELGVTAYQNLFRSASLTPASTVYNPTAGPTWEGFMKVEQYDQDDVLINTFDVWGMLSVDNVDFGADVVSPKYMFMVAFSTQNVGSF